jgi:hypothetical protein
MTVFPNMHPWGGASESPSFRPTATTTGLHHEVFLLAVQGRRPPPAAERKLGPDEPGAAPSTSLARRVFDQDEFNLEAVRRACAPPGNPASRSVFIRKARSATSTTC